MTDDKQGKGRFSLPGKGKDSNDKSAPPTGWRGAGRSMIFWLALFLIVFAAYSYYSSFNQDTVEITYSEFVYEIDNKNISEASFTDRDVEGRLVEPKVFASSPSTQSFSKFKTRIPFPDINYAVIARL